MERVMLNTPITSTPRTVKLISHSETKTEPWGISVSFVDGEQSKSIEWFFSSDEEMYAAKEMWETIIYAAAEFNYAIDDEQGEADDSE
jgi:hypothetical protein